METTNTKLQSQEQLYEEKKAANRRRNLQLAAAGVEFRDLDYAWISEEAVIESSVYIGAGVTINGASVIGKGSRVEKGCTLAGVIVGESCVIGEDSRIENSTIGSGSTVVKSVITESVIGEYTNIGPFAYIRPNCKVGDSVKIGDFVEIKNSSIGDGTKVSHLTYVGDSDLGSNINLGCGVVFVNYDGKKKHRSVVGDGAFIGCNVNIVSPVEIGENAYVAAGTTVTENVAAGSLGIGRSKMEFHEGWVERRGLLDK